jgi:alpha-tubulin suppressor-like RCC1 family protein
VGRCLRACNTSPDCTVQGDTCVNGVCQPSGCFIGANSDWVAPGAFAEDGCRFCDPATNRNAWTAVTCVQSPPINVCRVATGTCNAALAGAGCQGASCCVYDPAWPTDVGAQPDCPLTGEDDGDGVAEPTETWSGVCTHAGACVACTADAQCDDGDDCTLDACGPGGICVHDTSGRLGSDCTVTTATDGTCVAGGGSLVCKLDVGRSCGGNTDCANGNCVDGFCCGSACTDVCAACDVAGHQGVCTAVTGSPHGSRACAGSPTGPCAGSCDGVGTAACHYPTTACPPDASCTGGVGTLAGVCGAGVCNSSTVTCADALCGATACQTVVEVAVGSSFACARLTDGTVRCWGDNKYGQLGQGGSDTTDRLVPTPVPGLVDVIAIGAGDAHACAVLSDFSLRCWGINSDGELGIGTIDTYSAALGQYPPNPTPRAPCASGSYAGGNCVALTGVREVAGGPLNTCAIMTNGRVMCWGDNYMGQIGDGTGVLDYAHQRPNPTTVCAGPTGCTQALGSFNGGIVELSLGWYHVCALDGGHYVYCWGNNAAGELGIDPDVAPYVEYKNLPQAVGGITVGVQVPIHLATGDYNACTVISDGTTANNLVRCWGYGYAGNLGNGTSGTSASGPTPVTVCTDAGCSGLLRGATAVSGGADHNCAVAGGAVYCWGRNNVGQLGTGIVTTTTPNYATFATPSLVTAGATALDLASEADSLMTCARIQNGGTLRCWGGGGAIGNGTATSPQPTPTAQLW